MKTGARSLARPEADSREQALPICRRPVYPEQLEASIQRGCPDSHVGAAGEAEDAVAGARQRQLPSRGQRQVQPLL